MTQIQMTDMLSKTISVSMGEARAALEAKEWNLLEAAQLLQRQERARRIEAAQAIQPSKRGIIRDIIDWFASRHPAPTEAAPSPTALAPLFLIPSVYGSK